MANLSGNWDLEKSDNYEAFLGTLGLPDAAKNAAASVKPTVVVSKDGENWSILNVVPGGKSHDMKFKDGVEFEEGNLIQMT